MRISVIGGGVVGSATAHAFREGHEVRVFDVDPTRKTHDLPETFEDPELIFVCLPTPQRAGGLECDTSILDAFFEGFVDSDYNFVLRSTVPVGYTRETSRRLSIRNLVHSPEFLTARTAKEDACNPTRIVIGDPTFRRLTDRLPQFEGYETGKVTRDLSNLYQAMWPLSLGYRHFIMPSDESEAVKLFQNSFSAVKVAFFNEVYSFARHKGLDWDRCLEALLAGGWVNPMHTQVPGPDWKYGFGGSCLPKDLASLCHQMLLEELRADVCLGAYGRNLTDRERK